MPVLRKRAQVQSRQATGDIVQAPASYAGDQLRQNASQFGQMGAEFGRLMATEAEDKARALAKSAVFAETSNGMPVMPESAAKDMGRIAQRTYDGAIQERYAHQLTTAIRMQVQDAENANLYDYEAFQTDALGRLEAMQKDIPSGMEGAFQQISTGVFADAGISIGRRTAQVQMENAKSRYPVMLDDAITSIEDHIAAGRDDVAKTLTENTQWIDDVSPEILSDGQKTKMKRQLRYRAGLARMRRDLKLDEKSPTELTGLYTRLIDGEGNDKALDYFKSANGTVDRDMAKDAASEVMRYMPDANARSGAEARQAKIDAAASSVAAGIAEDTRENRVILDTVLSDKLSLKDESGLRRQIAPSDWLTMSDKELATGMGWVKTAGMVPESLRGAMRRLNNVRDPNEMEAAFPLLRAMKEAPNTHNKVISYADQIPDRVKAIYEYADITSEPIGDAMRKVDLALENADQWDDKELAKRLSGKKWGTVKEEDAQLERDRLIGREVFGKDVDARPQEFDEAGRLFDLYLRMGNTVDESTTLTKQSFDGRYVESKYMAGSGRSSYAPERYYSVQNTTFSQWVKGRGKEALARLASSAGWTFNALGILDFDSVPDSIRATPFDIMVNDEINGIVQGVEDPVLQEALKSQAGPSANPGKSWFIGGEDYKLEPDKSYGGQLPVYRLMMRDVSGMFTEVGTIDIRDKWKQFTTVETKLNEVKDLMTRRGAEMELDQMMRGIGKYAPDGEYTKQRREEFFRKYVDQNGQN